jgi:hypothetical protein
MPKVDDNTGEPLSDAPEQPADLRGGKTEDDPDLPEGSNPTGSDAPTQKGR